MSELMKQEAVKSSHLHTHSLVISDICHPKPASHQADPIKRARLRWRARRGLLENDLILTKFLDVNETTLTDEEVEAFSKLLEIPDNDLMSLILAQKELTGDLDTPVMHALVKRVRLT